MQYDLLIKGGQVVDGTGARDRFRADVAVTGGMIKKIGILESVSARRTIDARGFVVAPGFIDVLNRSDAYLSLFTDPGQESLVSQGITTIIGGNCGYSLAPLVSGDVVTAEQEWTDPAQINVDWLRMGEFLDRLSVQKLKLNFGTLVGYQTVIKGVLRGESRPANAQEHEIARFLCDQALTEGALGISLGLSHMHEEHDAASVISSAFAVAAHHDKIVSVHLEDEADRFLDSLFTVLETAKKYGVRLHISHLKIANRRYWHNFPRALRAIEQAKKEGLPVTFDVFPYASSSVPLYLLLPAWAKKGGIAVIVRRLAHADERQRIVQDIRACGFDYGKITIAARAPDAVYVGKTIQEIARNMARDGAETIIELLAASGARLIVFAHSLDEENIKAGIAHPLSLASGGGAGYAASSRRALPDLPHPRSFGAFPRLLRKYARETKLLSLEQAVAKATSDPAHIFRIPRRGVIAPNYAADIVIFNPDTVADAATFQDPYRYSRGVEHVIINGEAVFSGGNFIHKFPGAVIRQ